MSARYAIYYAPRQDSALWRKASAWLGRDAYTGARLERPSLGVEDLDLDALTEDPRRYGFHATLKAPFELASGRSEAELLESAQAFADRQPGFVADIAPAALGAFLAFRPAADASRLGALAAACVRGFEPFRAPLSDHDLARRRKTGLSPEQDQRLVAWGYPYVFEDFRFHMTLTGAIRDEAVRSRVLQALQGHFAEETGPHRFDGLAVFRQRDRAEPFLILERFALAAETAAA